MPLHVCALSSQRGGSVRNVFVEVVVGFPFLHVSVEWTDFCSRWLLRAGSLFLSQGRLKIPADLFHNHIQTFLGGFLYYHFLFYFTQVYFYPKAQFNIFFKRSYLSINTLLSSWVALSHQVVGFPHLL